MIEKDRATRSAFKKLGYTKTIEAYKEEVQELYLSDSIPWVAGYSGGKDSSAIVSLAWFALRDLTAEQRQKPVHVISTDTLVENPIVASWVNASLQKMQQVAEEENIPIIPHRLTPEVTDSFWVSLIGKGYPAPRNKFRWCTERLKIKPSNTFITNVVRDNGEAIVVLGTRKAESPKRSHNISLHARSAVRERLVPNASLSNSLIYTPIEDWSNDDVWLFLMRQKNPWGHSHKELMGMYRGASADGECPLVVDTSTPSCGNSRFGCWVCTLVDEDKSMAAMIRNDNEKEWMLPLLELRNEMDFRSPKARKRERKRRDFRRLTGKLTGYENSKGEYSLVYGPYLPEAREHWLRRVLEVQRWLAENAPKDIGPIELITQEELQEIRRIWVVEKHEIEDRISAVYEEVMEEPYPGPPIDDHQVFDQDALKILKESCGDDVLHYEMLRNLIDVEMRFRTMRRRRGLFEAIEEEISRCYYEGEEDALETMRVHKDNLDEIEKRLKELDLRVEAGDQAGVQSEFWGQENEFEEEAEEELALEGDA